LVFSNSTEIILMRVSRNEVKTTIAKATVGVGLPLGIGEELGYSAQNILKYHSSSLVPFAKAFDAIEKNISSNFDLNQAFQGYFSAEKINTPLSALACVTSVCDLILDNHIKLSDSSTIHINNVDIPAIIIFQTLITSQNLDIKNCVSWTLHEKPSISGFSAQGCLTFTSGGLSDLLKACRTSLSIKIIRLSSQSNSIYLKYLTQKNTIEVDRNTWTCICKYAERLLIKATDESRLTGAGAGIIDTD